VRNYFILFIGLLSLFLFSCVNDEGQGGISVIEGKVFKVLHYDITNNLKTDTFPAAKEDVYIVYGDEPIYGDKMETGYDGFFRFKYLTEGTYKVFAYSTYPETGKEAVIDTVTVGKGETKNTTNLYIHEGKSLETSYIKGTVLAKYYDKAFLTGFIPAYDLRVFIRVKGAAYQFDEIRTGLDGVFMFQGLSPGDYEVFVFTEQAGEKILSPVIQSVTITKKGVIETMETPFEIIINA